MKKEVQGLQIGHSIVKENEFKMQYRRMNDMHVEVPFSHRHFFYAIYWIHEGHGIHVIDFDEYEIKPDRIFFIRPDQIHFLHGYKDLKYSALQFTEDFMVTYPMVRLKRQSVFKDVSESEKERIDILFKQLQAESESNLPNSNMIIQSMTNTLLLELERLNIADQSFSAMPELLQEYKELIERKFLKERQVKYYAACVGVSPNYLNVLTKRYFGKSALEVINERVMLEIKRLLLSTDLNVSEIAYKLGFNELSYFSRFFKHNSGMTPIEFKISMNKIYQR